MSPLQDALGIPSTKAPIGIPSLVSYVVPPVACYLVFAMLAVMPRTRAPRVALWPVTTLLAFRAVVSVDISGGQPDQNFLNIHFMHAMLCIAIHTLSWTPAKQPLVRHFRPVNNPPSVIMDALDLATNIRGYGWDWSRGLHIPSETRPTNRVMFALYAIVSAIMNAFICGGLHRAIHTLTAGPESGLQVHTIFDETLPFFLRHFRAGIISIITAFIGYHGLQLLYNLLTVVGVVLFRQDPAQWPPAYDSPWRATSLTDFWGRRWHQFYRHLLILGAYPLHVIFGRTGRIVGVFLASAAFHHLTLLTFDNQSESWRMLVGFGMMAPGILAERTFYKLTGRKVDGITGWVWTMTWLLLWGSVVCDGFVRSGMYEHPSAIDGEVWLWVLLEKFLVAFDAWLHSI